MHEMREKQAVQRRQGSRWAYSRAHWEIRGERLAAEELNRERGNGARKRRYRLAPIVFKERSRKLCQREPSNEKEKKPFRTGVSQLPNSKANAIHQVNEDGA